MANLAKKYQIEYLSSKSRDEFFADCDGKYQEIKVIYSHPDSHKTIGFFDQELIDRFPDSLKFICHNGAGYDTINVNAAASRGIYVSNTPGAVDAVGVHMGLVVSGYRGHQHDPDPQRMPKCIPVHDQPTRRYSHVVENLYGYLGWVKYGFSHAPGRRRWNAGVYMGTNPEGKVLGILGMGGIGKVGRYIVFLVSFTWLLATMAYVTNLNIVSFKAVAKRAIGFDMKIHYHNRSRLDPEVERQYSATYVDFETFLRTSDIISVNVPLSKETTYLLSTREFTMMKDDVIIVNTARGKVIDEAALVKALEAGKVLTVGLDVFEE
ncbi:D-isomer specific 2-hydroxyacid dehydrogenase, partial [Jimgerdemannia flammicorona]